MHSQGLCVLHNDRRIHRDIKPANILINSRGMVKIGDFGISKKIDESFTQTFVGKLAHACAVRVAGWCAYRYTCIHVA
jgi:serine/threonine protein kinase